MEKINLNKITAVCIDGREIDDELKRRYYSIIDYMSTRIKFGDIKFIGTKSPKHKDCKYIETPKFGILDYSKFCLQKLTDYIETDFCLIFQDDGFVLNPEVWRDDFYLYDYIGSPWPLYMGWPEEGRQVGNGGFSLRSKKLLDFTKTLNHNTENEDTFIVSTMRHEIENQGLRIAPVEIARYFSVENDLDKDHNLKTCFGFHAKHQLDNALKLIGYEA